MNDQKEYIGSVEDFIQKIRKIKAPFTAYRGLADANWSVEASLCRRIEGSKKSDKNAPQSAYHNYIRVLLDRAKLKGFQRSNNQELSDLELLAQLQHNGAATFFIDFTYNPLIALWFACQDKKDRDGKVIIMPTNDPQFHSIKYQDLKKDILSFFNQDKWYKWEPTQLGNRIIAQQSVFIFGKVRLNENDYKDIHIDKGKKEEVIEDLKNLFSISEDMLFNDFTGFAIGNAHNKSYKIDYLRMGLQMQQQEDYGEAILYYDRAIEINPQSANVYFGRAVAKHLLSQYQEALSDFNKGIEIDPKDPNAYFYRGATRLVLKKYQEAITDFNQALELDMKHANAYLHRGVAKIELAHNKEAIDDFDKTIEINSQDADAYLHRGVVKIKLGKYQEAVVDCKKAIELDPKYAGAYFNCGLAKSELGKYQEAITDFDKVIELDPKHDVGCFNRGSAKYRLGKNREAIDDFDRAIEINPRHADAYFGCGAVKMTLGKYREAIVEFNKAIEFGLRRADAYFYRGTAKSKLGLKDAAQRDFSKAKAIALESKNNS